MEDETLTFLRNALDQHAHELPEQRKLRSPPQNNAQFRILAEAMLTPGQFSDDHTPVIRAIATPTQPFKPVKEITFVRIDTTYCGSGLQDKTESLLLETQDRTFGAMVHAIELVECTFDDTECFPRKPTQDKDATEHADCCDTCKAVRIGDGIPLSSFGNPLGCGISFPQCAREARLAFRIGRDLLTCLETLAPGGYDKTPKSIRVAIHFNMIGPALR